MRPDLLLPFAQALVLGDWRTALRRLFDGRALGGSREVADLARALRYVALSMRAQCAASDVVLAERHLDRAARLLWPPAAVATGMRDAPPHVAQLRNTTTLLVARERAELEAIRRIFVDARKGQPELVHAYVEFMTWVSMDPFTVRPPADDQVLLGMEAPKYARFRPASSVDLCARATRLRQFAALRSGSLSGKTWLRIGGENGLETAALAVLADEPLARARYRLPVRRGRLRAWQYARDVAQDLGETAV
jgi:hypothetical protein